MTLLIHALILSYILFLDHDSAEKENRGPLSDEEVRRKETIYFCFALAADDLSGKYTHFCFLGGCMDAD